MNYYNCIIVQIYLNWSGLEGIAYYGMSAIIEGILYPPGPGLRVFLIGSLYELVPNPNLGADFLSFNVL